MAGFRFPVREEVLSVSGAKPAFCTLGIRDKEAGT
jgi:hypothetical protein